MLSLDPAAALPSGQKERHTPVHTVAGLLWSLSAGYAFGMLQCHSCVRTSLLTSV